MVSYLVTATNGTFQTRFDRPGGLLRYDAVDPQAREVEDDPAGNPALGFQRLDPEPEIVRFFSGLYGDYPFESVGGIIDWAPFVGYALETQTKPNYERIPDAATVVHELSHQWWGDQVTIATWPNIWLNEGFATFSEWIYDERHGGPPAQERFDEDYATPEDSEDGQDLWFPAPAALPGPEDLFGDPGLRPRRDDAPGAARQGRRPHVLPPSADLVPRQPRPQRDDGRLHPAGRTRERPEPPRVLPRMALRGGQATELVRR